ncbi:thiamine phosphate synthase [Chryseolinea soli]|uniref:Thiamine-phosphate synthase n=1 Tax=Chryseolinea soli TaxID=2321403 RepID=A0A385SKW8_9BACT|nr:thiamine phosphate synthase [Chryseolinea soli]AYB31532.1 thiamine phosphate synthase [Chryseolinea soli]
MHHREFPYRLYLVTDEKACLGRDLIKVTEAAVKGGIDLVQIREKDLNQKAFLEKAWRLKEMLDRYQVPLIVNDNLSVAQACFAAGIHVGNSDLSPVEIRKEWPARCIVGYSIEDESQVTSVAASHADYLGISPVFSTPTKTDTVTEWGLDGIRKIRSLCTKPLVAIGGIKSENAFAVMTAGADCLAVVSAICSASDPARAAETIRMEIEKALK